MKSYSAIILILLIVSCKQQNVNAPDNSNSYKVVSYQATPILAGMQLNDQQLVENIKLAKDNNQTAVDKLIDHYLFIGDFNSHHLWCYEGERLNTIKGLFCTASIEHGKGGSDNCLHAIVLYKRIALQTNNADAMHYAQILGLNASKSEITCEGRFWSKIPVKKDMQ